MKLENCPNISKHIQENSSSLPCISVNKPVIGRRIVSSLAVDPLSSQAETADIRNTPQRPCTLPGVVSEGNVNL